MGINGHDNVITRHFQGTSQHDGAVVGAAGNTISWVLEARWVGEEDEQAISG